ncbi:MAG: DUF4388 domain-containing protein [Proteobacteria bacterium]|nr:DUF4388 domain-containing protein [Pseudomonadota bacterium]
MKVPLLKVVAVGEFEPWAKQFIASMQENEIIEVKFEPNIEVFCGTVVPSNYPTVVFIENNSDNRKNILKICSLERPIYILCLGKQFSREDFQFALEQRIYWLFEVTKVDEKDAIERLQNLSRLVESDGQFQQILRAMKSILLQTEAEFPEIPMVAELRKAVKKLESHSLKNELNHLGFHKMGEVSENLFHKNQTLGEALVTINELERTGVMWVRGNQPEQEGKIEFLQGRIVMASAGGCEGTKAIYRMFLWDKATLLFYRKDPSESSLVEHIDIDINQLSKMGELHKSKFEGLRNELPPPNLKLEINPEMIDKETALSRSDFSVLSSIVEFGTVSTVVDFNALPDVEIYESLIALRKSNLIHKSK